MLPVASAFLPSTAAQPALSHVINGIMPLIPTPPCLSLSLSLARLVFCKVGPAPSQSQSVVVVVQSSRSSAALHC